MTDVGLFRLFAPRPEWMLSAACRGLDPNLFYPEGGGTSDARAVCAACPVRSECEQYATDTGEHHGVWGGVHFTRRTVRQPGQRGPVPGTTWKPIEHGTANGYRTHRRRREDACQLCLDAAARARQFAGRTRNADLDDDIVDILSAAHERMDDYGYRKAAS